MEFFRRRKLLKNAKNTVTAARILLNMRRDVIPSDTVKELEYGCIILEKARRERDYVSIPALTEKISGLVEANSAPCFSPILREITETLVVAFGVAMAFRAYFFQPFKIPTGSMQPTLYGIHSVQVDPEDTTFWDKGPMKAAKWLVTGVWFRDVVADRDGRIVLYSDSRRNPGYVMANVCGEVYKIPADAMDRKELNLKDIRRGGLHDDIKAGRIDSVSGFIRKGTRIWSGYVISGDQIFANRMKWNFTRPARDQVMVFKTSLSGLEFGGYSPQTRPFPFRPVDVLYSDKLVAGQHYIKRLVGLPGEKISISGGCVMTNGAPVTGCAGMSRISSEESSSTPGVSYSRYMTVSESNPEFTSYGNASLPLGNPVDSITLGDSYFPLGDNTKSSFDGRFWGAVPRRAMVAPASFVWWPVSRRWGFIK